MYIDHARVSDPASSDRTVKSIVRDNSLATIILNFAYHKYMTDTGADYTPEFCDTELWEHAEASTFRRFQRNVLARARGRLVNEGLLKPVGPAMYKGQSLETYRLTQQGRELWEARNAR